MAANGTSNIHNDAYMTDSYAIPGPRGLGGMRVRSTWLGLEECASITFDSVGRIMALCGSLDGARLRLIDPGTLETLAVMALPPRSLRPGTTPLTDYCAAGYFYLDDQDRGVLSTNTNHVWIVSVQDQSVPLFVLDRSFDLTSAVAPPDCLVSVLPDWSGRLWFLSRAGTVGTIDRISGAIQTLETGELMANSFAVADDGGVFIVGEDSLYRFDAGPLGAPVVSWQVAYERVNVVKPGMLSRGSGTSPTLIGQDWVAIGDNADPMHVEVYERGSGVRICRAPVFEQGASATENSLISIGNSLIVENNFGYATPLDAADGASTVGGIARVDFSPDEGTCEVAWTVPTISPTTVPKASAATGMVYPYTKQPRADRTDPWYFTALDVHTGQTVYQRLTGMGYLYNNHYAPVSIGPDGAAYVGALGGLIRIEDAA